MYDEARHWRVCAESTMLVAEVAAQRGVNPLLVDLMLEDADRYACWAVQAAAREQRWWLESQINGWIERVRRAGFYPF